MDILVIVLILVSGANGFIKGFIVTGFSLVGYIIAGIIAKIYYPFLATYIKSNTGIFTKVSEWVTGKINGMISTGTGATNTSSILNIFKLPNSIKEGMSENIEVQNQLASTDLSLGSMLSSSLSDILISIISIVVVFVLARIVLGYLIRLLDLVAKAPVLKQFNKISGLILGLLIGILIIHVAFAILTPVILTSPDGVIAQTTYNSNIGKYFYTNNLIINALKENGIIN